MLKKFNPLLLFFIGSFVILILFTFTYWNYYQNNPEEIEHLRHKDWSKPSKVVGNVISNSYSYNFSSNRIDLFSIKERKISRQKILVQTTIDYQGNIIEENEIVRAGQISSPEVVNTPDGLYLFYFLGDSSRNQDLFAYELTQEEAEPFILQENISFSNSLSVITQEEAVILAYTERDMELGEDVIKLLSFKPPGRDGISSRAFNFRNGVNYPKLTQINKDIFLYWNERNPENMFISGQESKQNRYFLRTSKIDLTVDNLVSATYLDESYGNSAANLDTFQYEDELYFAWVKISQRDEVQYISIAVLDRDLKYELLEQITGFNPTLVVNDKNINLVYSETEGFNTYLNLFTYSLNGDDSNKLSLFPGFNTSRSPKLELYSGEKHLFWAETTKSGKDIYYSGTAEVEEISIIELMGFNTIKSPIQLLSSVLIYFAYPLLSIFTGAINFVIPILLVIFILYILGNQFNSLQELNNSTPYFSFMSVVIVSFFVLIVQGDINIIFALNKPVPGHGAIIISIVTLLCLGFIHFLRYESDHSFFIGLASGFVWLYWIAQAALVYNFHQFFI